jgi:hypothetical protein
VGELFRAGRLVAAERTRLGGVPLLRLRADPSQGDPDPRFFQAIRGLMNVTAPMAGAGGGAVLGDLPSSHTQLPRVLSCAPCLSRGHSVLTGAPGPSTMQRGREGTPASPAPPSSCRTRTTAAQTPHWRRG